MLGTIWRIPWTLVSKSAAIRAVTRRRGGFVETVQGRRTFRRLRSAAGTGRGRIRRRYRPAPATRWRGPLPGATLLPARTRGDSSRSSRRTSLISSTTSSPSPEHDRVRQVGERLRVQDDRATRDHQRVRLGPLAGRQSDACQVEHVEHVRGHELIAEAEAQHVEVAERAACLETPQRDVGRPQLGLEIDVRREATLSQAIGPVVQDFVEDPQAKVAHPDLIQVGVRETPLQGGLGPVLADGVPLAARVPARLADAAQQPPDDQSGSGGGASKGPDWVRIGTRPPRPAVVIGLGSGIDPRPGVLARGAIPLHHAGFSRRRFVLWRMPRPAARLTRDAPP